jgi:DNA-binding transcriptional LysR family regulator
MEVTLVQLRAFAAVVSAGTFTDAAIDLRVSQASVSRAVQGLERALGLSLVTRSSRSIELTTDGRRVLDRARRIIDEVEGLLDTGASTTTEIRVGYAWSALGQHTTLLQRQWSLSAPRVTMTLIQSNTATAGLAEGDVDVAIVRRPVPGDRFDSIVVGTERRYAAIASDDPLARRRTVTLEDFVGRTVGVDLRTGTTTPDLWQAGNHPSGYRDTRHVDDWLTLVAAGQVIGMTSEATAAQHPRKGIVFRPVRDAPRIEVRLAWRRVAPPDGLDRLVAIVDALLASPERRAH